MKLIHIGVALLAALVLASPASSHFKPGPHNAIHAIEDAFPEKHFEDAVDVAYCETSDAYWFTTPSEASNGQYKGIFQMGESERRTYGHSKTWPYHGRDPWHQAKAAARYFKASGYDWSPWECKPWWKDVPSWLMVPFL